MSVLIISLLLIFLIIIILKVKGGENSGENNSSIPPSEEIQQSSKQDVLAEVPPIFGPGMPVQTKEDFIPLNLRSDNDPWEYRGEWRDRNLITYGADNSDNNIHPFIESREVDGAAFGYNGYNATKTAAPYNNPQSEYMENMGYSTCYPAVPTEDNGGDVYAERQGDESIAHVGLQRGQRDKKAQDGWASKNTNYFKKFYSNELEEYEAKQWWGNNEY